MPDPQAVVTGLLYGRCTPFFSKLFEGHMLCWGTGRERIAEEYAALLQSAGWQYQACWTPPQGTIGVVEGRKV